MERIIIIVRDEAGVITGVTRALADAGINIESLNTERAGEQGIITLTTHDTDDTDTALGALAGAGFWAATDDFLVLRLPDKAGQGGRAGQDGGAVQGRGREHPELSHPGPPGRQDVGGHQHPRPGGSQKAAGPRSIV